MMSQRHGGNAVFHMEALASKLPRKYCLLRKQMNPNFVRLNVCISSQVEAVLECGHWHRLCSHQLQLCCRAFKLLQMIRKVSQIEVDYIDQGLCLAKRVSRLPHRENVACIGTKWITTSCRATPFLYVTITSIVKRKP